MIRINDLPRTYSAPSTSLIPCQDAYGSTTNAITIGDLTRQVDMRVDDLEKKLNELTGLYKHILNVHPEIIDEYKLVEDTKKRIT